MFFSNPSQKYSPHFDSLNKKNYMTIDTEIHDDESTYHDVKNKQMISTIMDTIDEKSSNPKDLKKSLSNFDKQFLSMYCSSIPTSNLKETLKFEMPRQNYPNQTKVKQVPQSIDRSKSQMNNTRKIESFPRQSYHQLKIPKPNTLTDKFMKQILGSEQELIQEYDRTVNPIKYQEKIKEEAKLNAKQLFKEHTVKQPIFMQNQISQFEGWGNPKSRAFHDDQYYTYLKTNMKYLSELNSKSLNGQNTSPNKSKLLDVFKDKIKNQFDENPQQTKPQCQYDFLKNNQPKLSLSRVSKQQTLNDPNPLNIIRKIKETGGIENTIQKMERSLKKNQLKHLKYNQYLDKKQSVVSQHQQKRLSINKSNTTTLSQSIKVPIETNKKKLFFEPSGTDKLKLNRQNQIINRVDPQKEESSKTNINWRQKSQSLRNRIQDSLEK